MRLGVALALLILASSAGRVCAETGPEFSGSGLSRDVYPAPNAAYTPSNEPSAPANGANEATDTPSVPKAIVTRQQEFSIPYRMTQPAPGQQPPREVQLFVSIDQGKTWHLISKAQPHVHSFRYHAPHDGEYWFSLRTLHDGGATLPAGEHRAELRVIVDTVQPRLDLSAERGQRGEVQLRWQAVDPNLQLDSLRIETRPATSDNWQPLAIGQPPKSMRMTRSGEASFMPGPGTRVVEVRAEVLDAAGNRNVSQREVAVTTPAATDLSPPADFNSRDGDQSQARNGSPGSMVVGPERTQAQAVSEHRESDRPSVGIRPDGSQVWSPDHASAAPLDHWSHMAQSPLEEETLPTPDPDPVSGDGSFSTADAATRAEQRRQPVDAMPVPLRQNTDVTPRFVRHQKDPATTASAIRMVNAGKFELEYDVEEVGPAGVARVELWGTRDQGRTWISFGTDPDNRSPIDVAVNEEGIYGFQIVIEAANGLGGHPPQSGDPPDAWIGVDMTPPKARLLSAQQGTGNEADQLIIEWQATDQNMARRGVSLLYSTSGAGPWSTVAAGLENTGQYAWRLPRDIPDSFLLRLDVRDAADNLTTALSPRPVELNRPRPKGRIRNVHPVEQADPSSAASQ